MNREAPFTHIAYADETNYNRGTYPGIALVSLAHKYAVPVSNDIARILQESNVQESKWEKLSSAKRRFAAVNMVDYAVAKAAAGMLRIDVLTWDLSDKRHKVPKLDKIANLQRMYYHLFRNVLRTRWPNEAVWRLCPDQHTALNWLEVQDFLDLGRIIIQTEQNNQHPLKLDLRLKVEFKINQITPCQSHKEPLIQLADLFAGLGSYSRTHYTRYQAWQQQNQTKPERRLSGRTGFVWFCCCHAW